MAAESLARSSIPALGSVTRAQTEFSQDGEVSNQTENQCSISNESPVNLKNDDGPAANKKIQVNDKMDLDPRPAPPKVSVEESSTTNAQSSKRAAHPVDEGRGAPKPISEYPNTIHKAPKFTDTAKYIPGKTTRDDGEICGYQAIEAKKGPVRYCFAVMTVSEGLLRGGLRPSAEVVQDVRNSYLQSKAVTKGWRRPSG
ncbi:hypothetical protein ASPWEDRAFT_177854 [Aspergillus wentii DTO 134E9]|uniref:Uncharacterized protein n=1 Tax=Aspergillus wentii DTO 134E9 TaxID=1073089 RepID=A0A1L9R3X2_ASPWE|nr:uncharacterized protein ASPWEDRAFT_177854 [Aspergillus wentii DTO 134E9]KAI9925371.1 hypothetical protein MW887_006299 [Aspergillus wentii]OJJ29604.1 hypothetical protein ASPWEDRAFT_177854 [Aspergillus wentii DTO 134E9]